jgi:hypothetical protein
MTTNRLAIVWRAIALTACAALATIVTVPAEAQIIGTETRSVGGISIDVDGLLRQAERDDLGALQRARTESLAPVPKELNAAVGLRKISLRRLQQTIAEHRANDRPLPDAVRYLAGLQRIQYIFVVPEQNDIVIAGPGEGWKVGPQGSIVGVQSGRPVMLLEDLVTALKSAAAPQQTEITCSIDPTQEGLNALRGKVAGIGAMGNAAETLALLERTLGRQLISITGVPADSHFARVLLAADYRMKRLAMNFDPSPVQGLPSFLTMLSATERGMGTMLPRWWLAPNYQPLLRDEDGLTWEIRGASVKAMTEDDFLTLSGQREPTGETNPVAQRWADAMTAKYDELAVAEPVFGQLQNCIDVALLAALVESEGLAAKAGLSLDVLRGQTVPQYYVPKEVDSQASLVRKRGGSMISVSGGVKINLRALLDKPERTKRLQPIRDEAKLAEHADWWWN